MGEYADVKRRKILRLLKWLNNVPGFSADNGGKHQWIVKHQSWTRPFPIPFKNNTVNKNIVKELMKRVTETGSVTQEDFDKRIG